MGFSVRQGLIPVAGVPTTDTRFGFDQHSLEHTFTLGTFSLSPVLVDSVAQGVPVPINISGLAYTETSGPNLHITAKIQIIKDGVVLQEHSRPINFSGTAGFAHNNITHDFNLASTITDPTDLSLVLHVSIPQSDIDNHGTTLIAHLDFNPSAMQVKIQNSTGSGLDGVDGAGGLFRVRLFADSETAPTTPVLASGDYSYAPATGDLNVTSPPSPWATTYPASVTHRVWWADAVFTPRTLTLRAFSTPLPIDGLDG